jgi:hypothetical protein
MDGCYCCLCGCLPHPGPTLGPPCPHSPVCLSLAPLLQGRGTNPALERGEAEDAFRSHVQELYEAALEAFLDLLDAEIKVGERAGGVVVPSGVGTGDGQGVWACFRLFSGQGDLPGD